jgi:hypothetical protein
MRNIKVKSVVVGDEFAWQDGTPTLGGIYQRDFGGTLLRYSRWDGVYWFSYEGDPDRARLKTSISSHQGEFPWRKVPGETYA